MWKLFEIIRNSLLVMPEDGTLPIDWCPRCKMKLGDRTVVTRKAHDRIQHPPPPTRKRIIQNIRQLSPFIALAVVIIGAVIVIPIIPDIVPISECVKRMRTLENTWKFDGVLMSDVDELNWMNQNCGIDLTSSLLLKYRGDD